MSEVEYETREDIAVLTLRRGRANALTPGVRKALADALDRAAQAEDVRAVVLCGADDVFSSGVDIAEYDAPLAQPWIGTLARRIETFPKPVVACLHGAALGAGFELALAAHARVVRAGTRLAQPEVTLSLVPGGGATQRLPRMLGAQAALEIMLSGSAVAPGDPRLRRLFDEITQTDPMDAALTLARKLANEGQWTRSCDVGRGFSDPEGYQKAVSAVRDRLSSKSGAEFDVLRCVEAAQLLPFEQGLAFEQAVFQDRVVSAEARAIRHVYTAERRAAVHPGLEGVAPREIKTVVLLGDQILLSQIMVYCLDRGQHVLIVSPRAGMLIARAKAIYDNAVSRGRLTEAARDNALSRLSEAEVEPALKQADLVLEGGVVELGEARPPQQVIWCVLDSLNGAQQRAATLGFPVLTLRVYPPAHSAKLVEFTAPDSTPKASIAAIVSYFSATGQSVLRMAARPGLLGHRAMAPGYRAALMLTALGANPYEIDEAALQLGFAQGIWQMIENHEISRIRLFLRWWDAAPALIEYDLLKQIELHEGNVFYSLDGGTPNPQALEWLKDWRMSQDRSLQLPEGVALKDALHAALVNGAAQMIDAREVMRASDVDLCFVRGYDFARNKGGPLLQADLRGLLPLVRVMKKLAPMSEKLWSPAPMVEDMVKYGRKFF